MKGRSFTTLKNKLAKEFPGLIFTPDEIKPSLIMSSGCIGIDWITRIGGYEAGRIYEISGPEHSGKTTLALLFIKQCQKKNIPCVYIDAEHSMDKDYARFLGVNVDELIYALPDTMEEAFEIVEKIAEQSSIDNSKCVVIDSFAALAPKREIDGGVSKDTIGIQASVMSRSLRLLKNKLRRGGCFLLGTNQVRQKVGGYLSGIEITPCGQALKHYASVRIKLSNYSWVRKGGVKTGKAVAHRIRAKVIKNRMGCPFYSTEFNLRFEGKIGLDQTLSIIDTAIAAKVLRKVQRNKKKVLVLGDMEWKSMKEFGGSVNKDVLRKMVVLIRERIQEDRKSLS